MCGWHRVSIHFLLTLIVFLDLGVLLGPFLLPALSWRVVHLIGNGILGEHRFSYVGIIWLFGLDGTSLLDTTITDEGLLTWLCHFEGLVDLLLRWLLDRLGYRIAAHFLEVLLLHQLCLLASHWLAGLGILGLTCVFVAVAFLLDGLILLVMYASLGARAVAWPLIRLHHILGVLLDNSCPSVLVPVLILFTSHLL